MHSRSSREISKHYKANEVKINKKAHRQKNLLVIWLYLFNLFVHLAYILRKDALFHKIFLRQDLVVLHNLKFQK